MFKKLLLVSVMTCFITMLHAQKGKTTTAYAITASEKGRNDWKEVRLIDIKTGKEIQSIFTSGQQIEILNARTGKPVIKKDDIVRNDEEQKSKTLFFTIDDNNKAVRIDGKEDLDKLKAAGKKVMTVHRKQLSHRKQEYDNPFATNSAAMAYDKKHDRLYYTPMGINQLRYIDLKAKTAKVYYFEDEAFGVVKGPHDVPAQVTRMVIASDGNGYALSNDANHLIRFTTGKKPTITDLGAVADDAANEDFSIHRGAGGDIIADNAGNLYLITAVRNVWKINIETKIATYMGGIKGLPEGYQTNGAAVEEGSKIIVASGRSTTGYYRFDLNSLQAEKIANEGEVYNASDLANANLAVVKKDDKPVEEVAKPITPVEELKSSTESPGDNITVYPNPVTDGIVKLSFSNQPTGKYNVQILDLSGRMISNYDLVLNSKTQVLDVKLPGSLAKGNYLIRVSGEDGRNSQTTKLAVQ